MMDSRLRRICLVLCAVAAIHLILGLYAVWDGGFFGFGATAPERLLIHALSQDESHITVSGAGKYLADDLCLQKCDSCQLDCYPVEALRLACEGGCGITTAKGLILAKDGDTFKTILKQGLLYQDAAFRCRSRECSFDTKLDDKRTFSASLPDGLTY